MSNRIMTGGSAFGLKPAFTDQAGWKQWRRAWRDLYNVLSTDIRRKKIAAKNLQRAGRAASVQKSLRHDQIVAWKMMSLLDEGKQRWQRILNIKKQIAEQNAQFPLDLGVCQTIDAHYNKASNEFPDLPRWVIKAKGKTFYVSHITANVPWTTREVADGPTKGMIRLRKANLKITVEGEAIIS